jgi:ATP-dependent Lhr-like helicase
LKISKSNKSKPDKVINWFKRNGWEPFSFQLKVWKNYLDGGSGLIHASTGTGKTYAAFFGAVLEFFDEQDQSRKNFEALRILWLTPLRALATDTKESLLKPVTELNLNWSVEKRTGDTSSTIKAKQSKRLPTVLITTPESISLLLSYPNSKDLFSTLKLVVADEWHELMGSKRGVLAELAIARLKNWNENLRIWGLSATIGNTKTAMETLLGTSSSEGKLILGNNPKKIKIETIIPDKVERFPWAGHLGTTLLNDVVNKIEDAESTLVFTNTRSQTEIWYQSILQAKPEWAGLIALHHGSVDKDERKAVEDLLRTGKLKCVVATSSLDLGVDFSPVDRIIQIGSPKGIARFLQRAGRSGHQPGSESSIICVPTNSFELLEFAAVRSALKKGFIELRLPIKNSIDVLSQHLVTVALGGGFNPEKLYKEIKTTYAFNDLSKKEWNWLIEFVSKGGPALRAYPDYSKIINKDGLYLVESKSIARMHRMSVGTITGDSSVAVQFLRGNKIGTIEESFISKMKAGDTFIFGGRALEYVRIKDMTVFVRLAKSTAGPIPQWMGGRMPLSTELSAEVRNKFDEAKKGIYLTDEIKAVKSLLELQKKWSVLPGVDEVLIEKIKTREGNHIFIYPFEGKLVHEGLASLFAYRIGRIKPVTFSISTNDYGFELLSFKYIPIEEAIEKGLFKVENLLEDILNSLNSSEMAKRQFREIARIAGLVFQGYPGSNKNVRQVQASSSLFYEVFKTYDPSNLLIKQADREVLERQLEQNRLYKTLQRISESKLIITEPARLTPLAFPLMINTFREKLSSEKLADRVNRIKLQLEKAADIG